MEQLPFKLTCRECGSGTLSFVFGEGKNFGGPRRMTSRGMYTHDLLKAAADAKDRMDSGQPVQVGVHGLGEDTYTVDSRAGAGDGYSFIVQDRTGFNEVLCKQEYIKGEEVLGLLNAETNNPLS